MSSQSLHNADVEVELFLRNEIEELMLESGDYRLLPVNDGENALRVLKIIEAAYESSKTGCRILLDK